MRKVVRNLTLLVTQKKKKNNASMNKHLFKLKFCVTTYIEFDSDFFTINILIIF